MSVLDDLARDLDAAGVVGVGSQAKAIYLCCVSRKLKKPQSFIAYGPSAAGKSFLADTLLSLVPEDDIERFDTASETALFYNTSPLSHRIVYVPETANLTDELQGLLRVLVSEGQLSRDFTVVEGQNRSVKHVERLGPCLVVQTSVDAIHPENETRALLIEVPDSPDQTRLVMMSIADQFSAAISPLDPTPWLDLDQKLPVGVDVVIERGLTRALSMLIPSTSVRMRRDFRAILTLVCAHGLLHHDERPVDMARAIVAGMDDYEVVREVLEPIVGVQTDRAVHPEVREFVERAVQMSRAKGEDGTVTAKAVGDAIGIDKRTAWRRAKRALRGEYLVNHETRKNQPAQLSAGSPMPEGVTLPTVAEVREWVEAAASGSIRFHAGSTSGSTPSNSGSTGSTTTSGRGGSGKVEPLPSVSETGGTGGTAAQTGGTATGSGAEPLPWSSPCLDYKAHQTSHRIVDGMATCDICSPPSEEATA